MLAPNTLLQNRYLIVRLLGQGGMGAVYQATDQRLGHTVALKQTFFTDEMMLKAFEREARLLASLRHSALPKVSDHFTESNGQFLVMDYIAGNDLMTMLEKRGGPFDADQVVEWADQLLGALAYLHGQHPPIIHRDIKPQNLKMTDQGQIILLDFGLAKGLPEQTLQFAAGQSIYGYTPDYAPLEQIKAEGTEARSDLYALAATLYHLLTNVTPPSALTRAIAVANQQPDPLRPVNELNPQVKPAVAQVLTQALALMREHRPATADAMRHQLRDADRAPAPAGRPANLPPTVVSQPPSAQSPTAPINPQPSQPAAPRPTQPGNSYPPPPSPSWPNAQPPAQPSWPHAQPSGWPQSPPQPSWPNAQSSPQPSWPQSQPPTQPAWPHAAPQWGGPTPSYAQPARKSRTGLWIVLGIVGFLVLGVVALAIIGMMAENNPGDTSVTKNSTVSNPPKTETYPAANTNASAANTTTSANANTASTGAAPVENVVDQILSRYVQALGGEQALRAVSSRVATGSFEVASAGVTGTAELYQKAPNKNLIIISVPGLLTSRRGFNGSSGWEVDAEGKVKQLAGSELAAMKRGSGFYRELNLRNDYSSLNLSGKDKVDGHDAFIITATAADGAEEKMYFDVQTGLLLRNDETRGAGQATTKTYFSDYRTVDGIKLPFTFRQEDGQTSAIIRFKEVRHDVTVNDSIFNVPSK
jgi:serine/threonine protein kinase